MLRNYGRSSKLLLAEKDIPDLHFDVTETKEKGEPLERVDVMEIVNVGIKESAQNSDSQEHSRNLLESVAGGAPDQMNQQENVDNKIGPKLLKATSEYREHSQELWSSEHVEEKPGKLVKRTFRRETQPEHSKN